MGDKVSAITAMKKAGVPTVPVLMAGLGDTTWTLTAPMPNASAIR